MNDTNSVLLIGKLTRDSEVRYMRNGTAVSNFSIAVNRRRKSGAFPLRSQIRRAYFPFSIRSAVISTPSSVFLKRRIS